MFRILSSSFRLYPFLIGCVILGAAERAHAADELKFETSVRAILKVHCFTCHGDEEHKAALDLRLVRTMLEGGDSGPVIVPGKPAESLLLNRVEAGEMPPGDMKKLSPQELEILRAWIEQGALTTRPEPDALTPSAPWTDVERDFWSFQPVRRPAVPTVKSPALVRTAVDAFLLAELEPRGLSFSAPADRPTLIRRLYFDLVGLPPTANRVQQFVDDNSASAYENLVDELLASPAYGERWARHWLDPAGYADSDGYTEADAERPWAYRYRDYVIRAMNGDKPWDEFLIEQLAGDELLTPPFAGLVPGDIDKLTATGFLRMAPDGTADGSVDANTARNDVIAETLKIVSTSLLGLTVGCAQCHNHRYDPISQVDYYRFRAIFEPAFDWKNWRPPAGRMIDLWSDADRAAAAAIDTELGELQTKRNAELDGIVQEIFDKEVAKLDEALREPARQARAAAAEARTSEQQQLLKDFPSLNVDGGSAYLYEPQRLNEFNDRYKKLTDEIQARRPPASFVACLTEVAGQVPPTHLFYRGDINQPREALSPGDLSILGDRAASIADDDPQLPTTGRRLALARHLTSGRHPLVGRVLVNRFWMHHFGRGLVASAGDFGVLGERPSHPELLNWLADEFVKGGWQLKRLHRLLVTSTAYRQSSIRTESLDAIDPDNRLLGRMSVRRLEAEAIRDAILEAAGNRNRSMFGPPLGVYPDDVGQVVVGKAMRDGSGILVGDPAAAHERARRSIYVQLRRSMPLAVLEPFDLPAITPNCDVRRASTAAIQSLLLLNGEFIMEQSDVFARRVIAQAGDDPAAQVRLAWQLALGRGPSDDEVATAWAFLEAQRAEFANRPAIEGQPAEGQPPPTARALASLCQALVCSNPFLYVD